MCSVRLCCAVCIFNLVPAIVLSLFSEYCGLVWVLRPLLLAKDGSSEASDAEDCETGSKCFVVLLALYLYVVFCVACVSGLMCIQCV